MLTGYIGSYADGGEGIYSFNLDDKTGILSNPLLFCGIKNSKYIADGKDGFIYSVYGEYGVFGDDNSHGVAVCDYDGKIIDRLAFDDSAPCYITVDEFIYTANYSAGTLAKLSFNKNKLNLIKKVLIKEQAGCHQIIRYNNKIFLPCLLLDKLLTLDEDLNIIGETNLPKNSGPRHGVISRDNSKLYLVAELSNELYTLRIDGDTPREISRVSLLPNGVERCEGSAAIRMSNNGRQLMVSTRFKNIITMLNIEGEFPKPTQHFALTGDHPRDILNVAADRYLLVANRFSDEIVCLELNNNKIIKQCSRISVPQGVSLLTKEGINE